MLKMGVRRIEARVFRGGGGGDGECGGGGEAS